MDGGFTVDVDELRTAADRIRQLVDVVPGGGVQLLRASSYGETSLIGSAEDFASRWGRALSVLSGDLEAVASKVSTCAAAYESTDGDVKAGLDACVPVAMG